MFHQYTAYALLISLYLQSCNGNCVTPLIPIQKQDNTVARTYSSTDIEPELTPLESNPVGLYRELEKRNEEENLFKPATEEKWMKKAALQSHLLAIPLLYRSKQAKLITRNIVSSYRYPSQLYSKGASLLGSQVLPVASSSRRISGYPLFTTKLTAVNVQNIKRNKIAALSYYKPLFRTIKEAKTKSYTSTKLTASSNQKPTCTFSPSARLYATNKMAEKIAKKNFFLKLGAASGMLGTLTYAFCASGSKHPLEVPIAHLDNGDETKETSGLKHEKGSQTLNDYRPNDWTHMYYAKKAYKNNGGKVLDGWKVLDTCHDKATSYFGSAYVNEEKKHIIIAHRGTNIFHLKDWLANLQTICQHVNPQQPGAWKFSKKIIQEYGPAYSYSFTGHSLGGWLALACLYTYKDELIASESTSYQDAFAVTFDDPGGKELLSALQRKAGKASCPIDVNKLDITGYLSYPNIVNTAMGHVGSMYALLPGVDLSSFQKRFNFTLITHDRQLILSLFDKDTGWLKGEAVYMTDWPKVLWGDPLKGSDNTRSIGYYLTFLLGRILDGSIRRGEYLRFYTYVPASDAVNSSQESSHLLKYQLKNGIHYKVEGFNTQILPLRNMPRLVRKFLEQLSEYDPGDRIELLNRLTGDSTCDTELSTLLRSYGINRFEELEIPENPTDITAREFRDKIVSYLKEYNHLCQNELSVLISRSILDSVHKGDLTKAVNELDGLLNRTKYLIDRLSSTSRLYAAIKPSWEEFQKLEKEYTGLSKQLEILSSVKTNVDDNSSLSKEEKAELVEKLQFEKQQLKIAKKNAGIWLKYMEEDLRGADKQLDSLITSLTNETLDLHSGLERKLLLNRAYNFKAKIAARLGDYKGSKKHYKKATKFLPHDSITWSNYGGLLTDRGRLEKKEDFHIKAYHCYEQIDLEKVKPEQLPVIRSGKAYGYIMLAQSIEKGHIDDEKVKFHNLPDVNELRSEAQSLLNDAVRSNPHYANARLFTAILFYDQGNYEAALKEVDHVLSTDPEHATGLMRKGFILIKLGKPSAALDLLKRSQKKLEGKQGLIEEIDEQINIAEKKIKKIENRNQTIYFNHMKE
jgi:tetratricopeptide (TPR) repeat protein